MSSVPASVIDMHSHFFPETWPDLAEKFGTPDWPWLRHDGDGKAMLMVGENEFRPLYSGCWDPDKRLEEMDRDGVDQQIFCATPILFSYARPAEQALDVAKYFNDAALELGARGKGRLHALCQVPLQDIDKACLEVSRAMKSGHKGVQIGNHVGEKNLDDDELVTFLSHCADIGAPVLVHPWDMMARERMPNYMLPWLVAMPAETQLSILSLILSGAFERLPKSLSICFSHGGGSFPYLLGRVENAWHHRDLVRKKCPNPPSHYLDRITVDSAVFDERALRYLIDVMGEDNILFGTDYPFPLGEQKMGSLIREADSLSEIEKTKLLGVNAQRFFAL